MHRFLSSLRGLVPSLRSGASEGGSGGPSSSSSALGGVLSRVAIGLGLLGWGFSNSLYNVEGGHKAIVFNRLTGLGEKVYDEGTHIMIPWFDRPIIYDCRTQPREIVSTTGSKDLQMVDVRLRLLYKPDPVHLSNMYQTLGMDYDERVLPSIGNEVLKSVVAQFNASELLTRREQVSREVKQRLVARARDFNILVDDVSLTQIRFGREYSAAVEAKQVAQQDSERAKFIVQKALQDKKSTIIRAEGEARSAMLIGEAMSENPTFLELRRLEAAKDIASTISQSANRVYLNADSLLLNLLGSVGFDQRAQILEEVAKPQNLDEALAEATQSVEKADADLKDMQRNLFVVPSETPSPVVEDSSFSVSKPEVVLQE